MDFRYIAIEGPLGWAALMAAHCQGLPVASSFHTNFDHYAAHYGLGIALFDKGDMDGAVAACREAIRLNPNYPEAYCTLGLARWRQGRLAEAIPLLRRGHELGSQRPGWKYPSAKWVAGCERALWVRKTVSGY